ncbi:MAG: carbohydrate binding domain-containing protein, partial [Propionibacteriaceae bacterium]|nr:carbohydrate binding domain-containing protein [Propionibacteriaceae bacterium]
IGDFTDLLSDSSFEGPHPWVLSGNTEVATDQKQAGTASLKLSAGGVTTRGILNRTIPVIPGDQYYLEFWVRRDSSWNGTSGNSKVRIGNQSSGNALVTDLTYGAGDIAANTWVQRTKAWTVPAGCLSIQVAISGDATAGNAWLDGIVMRRMLGGTLLVDGAIDGKLITGATIRTAASGDRLHLASNILRSYYTAAGYGEIEAVRIDPAKVRTWHPAIGAVEISAGTVSWLTDSNAHSSSIGSTGTGSNAELTIQPGYASGRVVLNAASTYLYDPATTSSSANAFLQLGSGLLDTYRRIIRSTSVRAAKRLIQDAVPTPMVQAKGGKLQDIPALSGFLALQPRTWYDRGEMVAAGLDPDTATETDCQAAGLRRIPGFIAEEVEAVDPLYVTYDPGKAGPVLSGVAYDRLAAAIHPVLADLAQRVEALESR